MFFLLLFYISAKIPLAITNAPQALTYSQFYETLKDNAQTRKIKSLVLTLEESRIQGQFSDGLQFSLFIPEQDESLIPLIRENVSDFEVKPSRTLLANIFYSLGPMILFILFLWYFAYRGNQMGSRLWSFGKVKAKPAPDLKNNKTTFNDVAGVDEAEEELTEIIEFLKDPKKFQKLGGKIPKGVLLVGPPGCGKTLLAKAVAGEASAPFFSISGSDFVEMFVGVGASRVRDLFEQGRAAAKMGGKGCIIFIDEIDAVGRLRFSGIGGGHDEREQTLNALLVEMDGFSPQEGLILVAATNRPDTLDPALLRPGRFDRQIVIDRPDIKGRNAILKIHVRNIKLDESVNLDSIARQTPGFSGADLANLCNEAALLAARRNKDKVNMPELQESIERVIAGPQRKSRVISKKEKEIVAYHEAGHALLSLLTPDVDPLHKVSIIPRGTAALGYTMQLPLQDRYIMTKSELLARMTVLLGGRCSEEMAFGEITTGAENDLEVATALARRMVCEFGMSDKLGHITFGRRKGLLFLGKDLTEERNYSEDTAKEIDKEIKKFVEDRYNVAKETLEKNKDKLKLLASTLLEKEVLEVEEVKKLLGIFAKDTKEESSSKKN
ncbi:MAG: ATP-dependent zinc metalloprotease FtsH [Candidatus Omnitrophica bacterium]|nr:ATP-dependent zinc metalloprotease FtsH [Candidatus Omnitrophota bacterium]